MATNRADTLDPALLRPGRLDRKIEFPLPSRREKRLIFQTITSKMNLGPDVDLEDCRNIRAIHIVVLNHFVQTSLDRIGSPQQRLLPLYRRQVYKVRQLGIAEPDHDAYSSTAVRKNRYVILPIDFEEAWKVCVSLILRLYQTT